MSFLSTLTTDDSIANEKDFIGGSRLLDSGVYDAKVTTAYVTKSGGGAVGMVLNLKTNTNQEIRQTLWMTSGTEKGCKNYYTDKNGDKQYLPGFIMANSLCLLTVGKEISQLDTEQKVIPVYNAEAKSEIPTKVDMLMDLVGKDIAVGVIRQVVDKTIKNPTTGVYEATGETREENEIDKFFRARDRMTTAEIRAQVPEAVFVNTWAEKWTGKVKEKAKGAAAGGGTAGLPGKPATASTKPTTSLFA